MKWPIKIRVGRFGVWNYWVSNFPNFLENGVILKKVDHTNTRRLHVDAILECFWIFFIGDNKIKKKNAYWKKPENKGLLKKVTWRQV